MALYLASCVSNYKELNLVMPFDNLLHVSEYYIGFIGTWILSPFFKFKFDNLKLAPFLQGRVNIIHAKDDNIIPYVCFETLAKELQKWNQEGKFDLYQFSSNCGSHQVYKSSLWNKFIETCYPMLR